MEASLRALYAVVSTVMGSAGIMLMISDGQWGEPPTTRQALGCGLMVAGLFAGLVIPLIGHRADVTQAYSHGYEVGFRRGHKLARPTVVPIDSARKRA